MACWWFQGYGRDHVVAGSPTETPTKLRPEKEIPLAGCQGGPYCFTRIVSGRPELLSAVDDGDHPEGRRRVHCGGVAVQLEPQVLARVHVQRFVGGDGEHLAVVGLEPERRVTHSAGVHRADTHGLGSDGPLGGRHRASDDARVRLDDVLHAARPLELGGAVDRLRDFGRRRHGHVVQLLVRSEDGDRGVCEQRQAHEAVPVEQLLAAGAAGVIVWHGNLLDQCARASPYQRALAASCKTGLCSSLPFKVVIILA